MASDGVVGFGFCEYLWIFGDRLYTSDSDGSFPDRCTNGKRDNEGWIIYQYTNNTVTTSDSIGKKLTLKEMLEKMK